MLSINKDSPKFVCLCYLNSIILDHNLWDLNIYSMLLQLHLGHQGFYFFLACFELLLPESILNAIYYLRNIKWIPIINSLQFIYFSSLSVWWMSWIAEKICSARIEYVLCNKMSWCFEDEKENQVYYGIKNAAPLHCNNHNLIEMWWHC